VSASNLAAAIGEIENWKTAIENLELTEASASFSFDPRSAIRAGGRATRATEIGTRAAMSTTTGKSYLDPKTLEKIKRLDVRARLVVEGFVTGEHKSPYHGFAVEFAGHREYSPGDDIKHIDWKVWSKTDRYYIKQYEEETNLRCTILVDASRSMGYSAAGGWSKFDYAATAAASLAYLLQQQQDAVGMITFNTRIVRNLPPSSHPGQLKLMLQELESTRPDDRTDVADVFGELARQIGSRGLVVLVSDLFVPLDELAKAAAQFRLRRHELVVFHVMHDDELTFPFRDNTLFRGLEIDLQLHAEPPALRRAYLEAVERYLAETRRICATAGADYVLLNTKDPLDAALAAYLAFRTRTRRARRS
jgi:uncharacterized protein (DUF58 family)